jgi:hypothetical protein
MTSSFQNRGLDIRCLRSTDEKGVSIRGRSLSIYILKYPTDFRVHLEPRFPAIFGTTFLHLLPAFMRLFGSIYPHSVNRLLRHSVVFSKPRLLCPDPALGTNFLQAGLQQFGCVLPIIRRQYIC